MKTRCLFIVSMLLLMVILSARSYAQEERLKSLIVTKCIEYIKWPSTPIIIEVGVLGNSRVLLELEELKNKKNLNFNLHKISTLEMVGKLHVIYVPDGQLRNLDVIKSLTKNKNIIIIIENREYLKNGIGICLYKKDDKLKIAINNSFLQEKKFVVSSSLLKVSEVI